MHSFGFKIVDQNESIVIEIIDRASGNAIPLEIGLYEDSKKIHDYMMQRDLILNVHFNHRMYTIVTLDKHLERFREDILLAKRLGATYGIQHIAQSPMTKRDSYSDIMYQNILDKIEVTERLCEELEFTIHIENTYEDIAFYRHLFREIHKRGLKHIHFCFDLGHAKVWSLQTFQAWMLFLDDLIAMEFRIHFHLHANRGLSDEHLSFTEMEAMDFNGIDGDFSSIPYSEMLKIIAQHFPHSRKVFEVKPKYAFENRAWVEKVLTA